MPGLPPSATCGRVPLLPVTAHVGVHVKGKSVFYLLNTFTSSITSSTPKLTFKSWNVIKFDETVPSRRRAGPLARTRRCDRDGALCRRRLSYKDPCSIRCDATRKPQTQIPKAGAIRAMYSSQSNWDAVPPQLPPSSEPCEVARAIGSRFHPPGLFAPNDIVHRVPAER